MPFAVEQSTLGPVPLLRLSGEIDIEVEPEFRAAIIRLINEGHPSIALDLHDVTYMDSTGLRILISAKKRTAERQGTVYIIGCRGQVRRVFDLLSMERLFVMCDEEAVARANVVH
jgi:anti-sigma B factor antagonist